MKKTSKLLLIVTLFSSFLFLISCDPTSNTEVLPVLTTTEVSAIAQTTATCGGNISVDGGKSVIARGVTWSTNATPTIADNKTTDGTGTGSFTSTMTGLIANTTYNVRAYATTSAGTGYGTVFQFTTITNIDIPTVLIPSGTFTMGSPTTEETRSSDEIQHSVTLIAFSMSKYEINNEQYAAFLNAKKIGSNGLYAAGAYPTEALIYDSSDIFDFGLHYNGSQWIPVTGYENTPVIDVTWYGATVFATYVGGTLPTEAQWEYACRAGTSTPYNTGNILSKQQANFDWIYSYGGINTDITPPNKPQMGGTYAANAYGLYDMHGNVWEWCADWYGTYPTTAQTNPTGAATGEYRVFRGGSWGDYFFYCRSAIRRSYPPSSINSGLGFRVVFVH